MSRFKPVPRNVILQVTPLTFFYIVVPLRDLCKSEFRLVFYSIHKGKCKCELQTPQWGFQSLASLILFFLSFPSPLLFLTFQANSRVPIDLIHLSQHPTSLSHHHRSQSLGKWQVCRISVMCQPWAWTGYHQRCRNPWLADEPLHHTLWKLVYSFPVGISHFLLFSQVLNSVNGSSLLSKHLASYFPERT